MPEALRAASQENDIAPLAVCLVDVIAQADSKRQG